MKIKLYFDIYPGLTYEIIHASTCPGAKGAGAIRYAVEVNIPDPMQPDVEIRTEAKKEI